MPKTPKTPQRKPQQGGPLLFTQQADVVALFNHGVTLHQLGRLPEAQFFYENVLEKAPNHFEALRLLGIIALQHKNPDRAIELIGKSIQINPNNAAAYNNHGNALKELNRFEDAVTDYDKAVELMPNYAEAYFNRGNAHKELKEYQLAVASYETAISLKPDYADAYCNLGVVLQELQQLEAAIAVYDKAIEIRPDYAEILVNRGNALKDLKQFLKAVASYDRAIKINPDYAEAHFNRGNALKELKRAEDAIASYGRAIQIKSDYAEAYFNRGFVLQDLKQFESAVASYEQALEFKPGLAFLLGTLMHARSQLCDWSEFDQNNAQLKARLEAGEEVAAPFIALTLFDEPDLQKTAAQVWVQSRSPANLKLGPFPKAQSKGKIRLGYYSADFHNHATAYLMADLFESHDRSRFELYAFSFGPDFQDEMRARVSRSFDKFMDVRFKSDEAVAALSRELGIDIAVDLKGYTQDQRAGIFSYRCAPIQVNYLGYPGTMGADYIDYLIADKTIIPPESQQHYTEKIVYLPHSYQVNDEKRKIAERVWSRAELGLPEEGFVFCCFNNNYKITPPTFDVWMRLLRTVQGSVLWLLEDNQVAAQHLRSQAQARGVEASRLVFAQRMPLPEHLARHRAADLFLDTLPYNAHTTASDALWAGLPVLTQMGESFAARVAASLLNAIGLPELITKSQEEYEAKALALAMQPELLKELRDKLASNRLTQPLFNTPLFTKQIQDAYTAMHERHQAGLAPEHMNIGD